MAAGTLLDSLIWGFVAGVPLLAGSVLAVLINIPKPVIAAIMAFGAGVLIAALAFSLIDEAFNISKDLVPVTAGFTGGGLSYSISNYLLNKKAGTKHRKQSHGDEAGGGADASGKALLVGSLMDSIPENMALGISIVGSGGISIVLLAAIFISNFPEGLGSSQGMKSKG